MLSKAEHAAWLEARKAYCTASDVAAVMGINPHKSRKKVFEEKVGLVAPANIDRLPVVMAGKYLEAGIFGWHLAHRGFNGVLWEDISDCGLVEAEAWRARMDCGLVVHPSFPSLAVTPDGVAWVPDLVPLYVTEVKNVGLDKHADSWAETWRPRNGTSNIPVDVVVHSNVRSTGIEASKLRAPRYYWAQLQAQMSTLGIPRGRIVVCFGGQSRADLEYTLDTDFEGRMLREVTRFMDEVNAYRDLNGKGKS